MHMTVSSLSTWYIDTVAYVTTCMYVCYINNKYIYIYIYLLCYSYCFKLCVINKGFNYHNLAKFDSILHYYIKTAKYCITVQIKKFINCQVLMSTRCVLHELFLFH